MPIRAPKNKFWFFGGVYTFKRDWSSSRPQKAHPWSEPRLHGDFGGDPSCGATRARAEETNKGKERNLQ